MDNIISLERWKSERQQRRISPLLQQADRLRQTARMLIMHAEMLEMEASDELDYEMMSAEKVANLEALHNA